MKLSELRNGMLAQDRNGDWYVVIKDTKEYYGYTDFFVDIESGDFTAIDTYTDDLRDIDGASEFDIIKVAECDYVGDAIRGIQSKNIDPEEFYDFKVLWDAGSDD